ncbi:MAG: hypothetical protein JNM90_14290 [Burkholderiales bacterium]|nr:hypothetical protein [Burkholderiales bacterium]
MTRDCRSRILVITFSFRPLANPRAYRWSLLAERLAARGEAVDVITASVPNAPAREELGGLVIHRVGWAPIEALRARLRGRRERAGAGQAPARPGPLGRLRAILLRGVVAAWRAVHWPDASCLWFWPARAAALRLAREARYDVIVSVAPAFTAVLVGEHVRRACPEARWLIDIGDPFSLLEESPPNNVRLFAGRNRRSEARWLAAADAVTVTNENVRRRYADAFIGTAAKLHVIPPVLSLPAEVAAAPAFDADGRRALVYIGTLYRGLREPGFLLELFARAVSSGALDDCDLHFVGDVSACADVLDRYRGVLGGRLKVHGLVDRERIAGVMAGAAALINIGNDSLTQLPSKLVEYAYAARPVINIARTADDTSVAFFTGYPLALNLVHSGLPPDDAQVANLVRFLRAGPSAIEAAALRAFIAPFAPDAVVGRYCRVLDGIRKAGCA